MKQFTRSFPQIGAERVILRLPQLQDASAILHFHQRNQAHLESTSPPVPKMFYTLGYWENYTNDARRSFQEGTSCRFLAFLREDPSLIVAKVNFTQIFRGPFQACYLGYAVDAAHEGKGFMFESCQAGISYVFDALNLHRVMANYLPTNERSGRLLRNLGFQVEGYARDYLMINGAWQDHILTGLTNVNWKEPRAHKMPKK